jgi:hypothetical protein
MKICTLVLTYDTPLYNHFDKIKRSYLEKRNEDFYFVYNGTDTTKHNPNNRELNYFSDVRQHAGIPVMYLKFIKLIQSGLLNDYDFIIRVNSSTFLNLDIIKQKLSELKDNVYMGFFDPAWHFVSGACIIFSQDMLQLLGRNFDSVNFYKEDDVVIGDIMSAQNAKKTYLDRYCLHNLTTIPTEEEIKTALTYPQIRVWNPHDRMTIDTGIWDKISNLLYL